MLPQEMVDLGSRRSTIRELFEYGKQRAAVVGPENVYDFSIGNPNVPAPECVTESIYRHLGRDPAALHGYTSAQGDYGVRKALAESLNRRFHQEFRAENLYLTVGAAASLSIALHAICEAGDEVVVFAPYFPEYSVFVSAAGAKLVEVPPRCEDFQIDFDVLAAHVTPKTKAVLINSPNNPSGVVYSKETAEKLAALLKERGAHYGHPIYLISDEPYREIVYGAETPFWTSYYSNTVVCYSYSKSLSLPGERIGYVLVPDGAADSKDLYHAVCGAGRYLGYVCAPSLFQYVIADCDGATSDLSIYRRNRDLLYHGLVDAGFSCVEPEGAFYLFPRALEADANGFCERAKKYDLLIVPGNAFGCPGHVRISYCVSTEQIERALPAFRKLAAEYR